MNEPVADPEVRLHVRNHGARNHDIVVPTEIFGPDGPNGRKVISGNGKAETIPAFSSRTLTLPSAQVRDALIAHQRTYGFLPHHEVAEDPAYTGVSFLTDEEMEDLSAAETDRRSEEATAMREKNEALVAEQEAERLANEKRAEDKRETIAGRAGKPRPAKPGQVATPPAPVEPPSPDAT